MLVVRDRISSERFTEHWLIIKFNSVHELLVEYRCVLYKRVQRYIIDKILVNRYWSLIVQELSKLTIKIY